jgi:hypothetical protein
MLRHRGEWLAVLGLSDRASDQEIEQTYRELVQVWHPDRFRNNPRLQLRAQEKLKEINRAYGLLKASQRTSSQGSAASDERVSRSRVNGTPLLLRCPSCLQPSRLRVNSAGRFLIRCPHCRHAWECDVPDAAVPQADRETSNTSSPASGWPRRSKAVLAVCIGIGLTIWGSLAIYRPPPPTSLLNSPFEPTPSRASSPEHPPAELDFSGIARGGNSAARGNSASSQEREISLSEITAIESTPCGGERDRPETGTELGKGHSGGLGSLRIQNGTDDDALAVLIDEVTKLSRRATYIRQGETATLTSVPGGTYELRFQFGRRWLAEGQFCELVSTALFEEPLDFTEQPDGRGTSYSRFEVTLHRVRGGAARTHSLPNVPLPLPR